MSAYEGKRQPTAATGWLQGFTSWLRGLSPQYVTRASSTKATTQVIALPPAPHARELPSAPSGPPATSGDAPSGSRDAASAAARDPSSGAAK